MILRYSYIKYLLFALLLTATNAFGQSIEILFEQSAVMLASSRPIEDMNIASLKDHPQALYRLFYKYYFPESLEEYKSLFHEANYPQGIENNYDLWRKNMSGVKINITGLMNGLYKAQTTSILNFSFIKDGLTIRMSFFAKLIDDQWYPYEAVELMSMHDLSIFFPVVNPKVFQSILVTDIDNDINSITTEVLTRCGTGKNQFSAACLYSVAEQFGISQDSRIKPLAEKLFLTRTTQGQRAPLVLEPATVKNALQEYSIPQEETRIITYYLNRGEIMLAYMRIQYHMPGLQIEQINEKMKTVLHDRALQIQNTINK